MTVSFTKKELEALIENADQKIARLKSLRVLTIDEEQMNEADLRKLEATRQELVEQLKSAPA